MTEAQPASTLPPPKSFLTNIPFHLLALLSWGVGWMVAQRLFDKNGFSAKQQVLAFVVLVAAVYGAAFLARRDGFYQLVTSIPFAISQILFMALTVLIELTHSVDLCRSLGFYALLSLLTLSMLCVAWKRRPYPAHRIGFLLVHVSTSLILMGGLWGNYGYVSAFAKLRAGESIAAFEKAPGAPPNIDGSYVLPGFRLRLKKFNARPDDLPSKLYAFVEPDGKGGFEKNPKAYKVKPGLKARLPLSKLYFQVQQFIPNAVDAGEFINNPNAPEDPALRVMLGIGEPQPVVGDLFSRGKPGLRAMRAWRRDEPGGRFAVAYQDRWSPELLNQLRPALPTAEKIILSYGGKTLTHDAMVGSTWDLPAFGLKVDKLYPDFAVKKDRDGNPQAYSRSPNPLEPWLELSLKEPKGASRRVMLSARNPGLSDQLNGPNLPQGLTLRYVREGEERQSRFVVFTREDRAIRLVENGRVSRTEPFQLNKPFIVEKGLSVTAVAILDHAEYVPNFVPHPDPKEALKFDRPVLRVKVWDPDSGRAEERWLDGLDSLDAKGLEGLPISATFMDRRVGLTFQPKPNEPKNVRSELEILDDQGKVLAKKAVGVHEPFIFQGHWFYLGTDNPDDSSLSNIRVVREPGLWLVYLGFLCLIVGTAWMFYLKPVLKRRADEKKEA